MCGSLPKDLPFCHPESPDWKAHDCMTCIVECYGETVGQVFECGIEKGWVPQDDLNCLNHFAQGRDLLLIHTVYETIR